MMSSFFWWLGLAGVACLGATCGSFLNVVVYRIPRGMGIAYPNSHCPHCGHVIRPWDNIPIVSWLRLGGRCRDCQHAIPSRYLAMETRVMLLFLLVGLRDVFLMGKPDHRVWHAASWLLDHPDRWIWYFAHMLLLLTAVALARIAADGAPMPLRLLAPAFFFGLVFNAFSWQLMRGIGVVLGSPQRTWETPSVFWAGIGVIVGGMLAALAQLAIPHTEGPAGLRRCSVGMGALVGCYLGPMVAVLVIGCASLALACRMWASPGWRDGKGNWLAYVGVATTVAVLILGPRTSTPPRSQAPAGGGTARRLLPHALGIPSRRVCRGRPGQGDRRSTSCGRRRDPTSNDRLGRQRRDPRPDVRCTTTASNSTQATERTS